MNKLTRYGIPLAAVLAGVLVVQSPVALAKRSSTVFDGPGFKIEEKKGWFGTSSRTYRDALGNTMTTKKGLFGRETHEQNLFGSQAKVNGRNMVINGPDGKPLIEKKRGWFRGEETRINGQNIYENIKTLIQDAPAQSSP